MPIHACSPGTRKRTTAARLLLALTALATLFALAPQSAAAGTYVMRSCNVPGQAPAPVGPWGWKNAGHSTSFNSCDGGGGFGVRFPSLRRMQQFEDASLVLQRPDSGPQRAISIQQLRLWMVARLSGSGAPAFTPYRVFSTSDGYQQGETFGPPGGNSLNDPIVTPTYAAGTRRFQLLLFCTSGAPGDCYLDDHAPLEIRGAEVTLEESIPPSLAVSGGTLASGSTQSGVRNVGYNASDAESGVAKVEILLDDQVVAVRDFSTDPAKCPHTSWSACQEQVTEEVPVDTRSVPDGTYTLGARVTDAAGNSAVARQGQVTLGNGSANATGGPTGGQPSGIHLTHVNSKRTFVTSRLIRYGSRATLRGVLRDPAGDPIPNAAVDVLLQTERKNSRLRKVTSRTTDANGRFEYRTNPGPSRLVRVGYDRNSANSTYAFTHDVKVRTKSGVTLHASRSRLRNGQGVRFYGTIRGNRQRKVLEVQVRKPGGWDTIASVRSNSKGRWSWRYRFKRTFEPTRYAFRARVRTENGFPYATGHSSQRYIRVR